MQGSAASGNGAAARQVYTRIAASVAGVVSGQDAAIRLMLAALASDGHILLEDYPGTGKTTLAKALARSIGAQFGRVQFTPDLLPSDILGVSVFDQRAQRFDFRPGPVFTHILLADEINRASPRTQSALLEAMAEGQVTVEGATHALAPPFLVIATQNPVEFRGTYPLPEAQMDRFMVRLQLGYLDLDAEVAMVAAQAEVHPLDAVQPCASIGDVLALRDAARRIRVADVLRRYAVELVQATRSAPQVQLGAGPRASLAVLRMAQALALFDGEAFVSPQHLHECAVPVIAHRIVLDSQARFSGGSGEQVVNDLLTSLPVPV